VSEHLLKVRGLSVRFPQRRAGLFGPHHWLTAVDGVDLDVVAGQSVGIVGESGCGKSTLARAILGVYKPVAGTIRLDGAELDQWNRVALGQYIGYLPQDVELLDGTVSENIARFGEVDADKVVAAAQAAGVHEMILKLPDGYDTRLIGNVISAGQRQRIGLARALYADPKLIVLDEPNSNLDQDGDAALMKTLEEMKHKARTIVIVTHRSNVLALADKILVLAEGQIAVYGDRDKVLTVLKEGLKAIRPSAGPAPLMGQAQVAAPAK
jgi:ATP-binding cassette subfamily C protein EexD